MPRGRPPQGPQLLGRLEGSAQAKDRLRVILQTLAGQLRVSQACAALGMGASRFHLLRTQVLQEVLTCLEPKPHGRPRRQVTPEQEQITQLQKELDELKFHLHTTQVREEIALLMPHLLKPRSARQASTKARGGKKQLRHRPPRSSPRPTNREPS